MLYKYFCRCHFALVPWLRKYTHKTFIAFHFSHSSTAYHSNCLIARRVCVYVCLLLILFSFHPNPYCGDNAIINGKNVLLNSSVFDFSTPPHFTALKPSVIEVLKQTYRTIEPMGRWWFQLTYGIALNAFHFGCTLQLR